VRGSRAPGLFVAVLSVLAVLVTTVGPAKADYSTTSVSLAWHPAGPVHSSISGSGVVYVGGKLDGTGGIAALDPRSGDLLWSLPADGDVRALALSPDGSTLYAGGGFTTVDGLTRRHVVAVDTTGHSVVTSWKGSTDGTVRDLAVWGSDVYVAGKITHLGGVAQRGVGALDAGTGKRDARFDFSADGDVLGLALTGSRLILSGSFTQINGAARSELASIDLSADRLTGWTPAKLCDRCDQYWDVQTDGTNAYVATSGNAGAAFSLATGDQAWPKIRGTGDFQAVWLPGDGRVYFGGHFGAGVWSAGNQQQEVDAKMLVGVFTSSGRIDSRWTPRLVSSYPGVWTFTSTDQDLWVGGDFTGEQVNGTNNRLPYLVAYPDDVAPDTQAPTGTFTTDRATGWAEVTRVRVVQSALHDNVTPDNRIDRSVSWGDGTTTDWSSGTTVSHVYRTAGIYTPLVTLTDDAGNSSAPLPTATVTVKRDSLAPVVKLRLPGHRHSVDAWRTLRGTATDAGTGVANVAVRVVQKRGTSWYGYNARTHHWVKAASRTKAFGRSAVLRVKANRRHLWAAAPAHLRRGVLVYRVWATDRAGNRSATVTHRASLTSP
jgi:hypothetical protein